MNFLNWDSVINNISTQQGVEVTTDPARWNLENSAYTEIYSIWKSANFNPLAIKWVNYYPGQHFPEEMINKTAELLNLTHVHRSWISKIDPGFFAPWHWDVDDNEEEYLQHGKISRFTIIIKKFAFGHIFILNDDYLYNLPEGEIIQWPSYKDWHSGINAGFEPNFMLHILGVKNDL